MHDRHSRELRRHYRWSTSWPILSWSIEGSLSCHSNTVTSTYPQLSSSTTMEQWGLYAVQHLYCDLALSLALESYSNAMLCQTYTLNSTYPQLSSFTTMEQWGLYAVPHLYCDFALSLALQSYSNGAVRALCCATLILWPPPILSSRVLQQWSSEGSMLCHTYTVTLLYP